MTRNALPVPVPERRALSKLRAVLRNLSPRAMIVIFVAVLILFRWLHLILALEVAATGRQIQIASEERQKHEWQIDRLEKEIAEAESPKRLAILVPLRGIEPRPPEYLPLEVAGGLGVKVTEKRDSAATVDIATSESPAGILDSIAAFLTGSASVTAAP